ncbi:hypothetical protein [Moraxella macacae]|nr:hypothetical protein [Moraxella macacae]
MSKKNQKKRMRHAIHQRREDQIFKKVKTAGHFSYLSKHAVKRLRQRTQMTTVALTHLLDNGGMLNIGRIPGLNRQSLLFYSPKDEQCFVALRNDNIGKIITVWLLEYHKQLAWAVTEEQCKQAKQLYLDYQNQHDFLDHEPFLAKTPSQDLQSTVAPPAVTTSNANKAKPKRVLKYRLNHNSELVSLHSPVSKTHKSYIISALYISKQLQPSRRKLMRVSVDVNKYNDYNCHLILQDSALIGNIDAIIAQKRLQQGSIYALMISDKKNRHSEVIGLRNDYEALLYVKNYLKNYEQMLALLAKYHGHQRLLTWKPGKKQVTQQAISIDDCQNNGCQGGDCQNNGYQGDNHQGLPKWLLNLIFVMILVALIYQLLRRFGKFLPIKLFQNRHR